MDSKILALAVVLILVVAGVGVVVATNGDDSGDDSGDAVTVTDVLGREVVVPQPVEKVAFGDCTVIDVFAPAVGEKWTDYVGMWPADFKSREPGKEAIILADHPEFADLPVVPDMFQLLMTGNGLPVDEILTAAPDLFLMPSSMFSMLDKTATETYLNNFTKAGIPVLCIEVYDKAFDRNIAELTYGNVGKVMGTYDTAKKVIDFYYKAFDDLMDLIKDVKKDFTYMVEMSHPNPKDSNVKNLLAWTGAKELEILGGSNICNSMASAGSWTYEDTVSANNGKGPDYIMVADTPFYGNPQWLGHGITSVSDKVDEYFADMYQRPGYDILDAIKNDRTLLAYGETRNSMFGIADLYNVAQFVYPDTVTDEVIAGVFAELDALCPFGFNGIFVYHYDSTVA